MVQLNPDVQGVQIPEEEKATRPIEQPGADKSKGMMFESFGKDLSNAGDLFKEAVKVKDYTNEQYLKNRFLIEAGGERDARDEREKIINQRLSGVDPDISSKGLLNYDASEGPSPQMPKELTEGFANKAETMAAARANLDQLDVYYQGRINALLKRYRTDYPDYRDYIDKVAERNGFGQGANEYFNALRKANLAIQAQLAQNNPLKEMLPYYKKALEDSLIDPNTFRAIVSGDPEATRKADSIIHKQRSVEETNRRIKDNLANSVYGEANWKANTEAAKRDAVVYGNEVVAADMANTEKGHLGWYKEQILKAQSGEAGKVDPQLIQNLMEGAKSVSERLQSTIESHFRQEFEMRTPDPMTGEMKGTGKRLSQAALLGDDGGHSIANNALAPIKEILAAAGSQNFNLANSLEQHMKAFDTKVAGDLYKSPSAAVAMALSKATINMPEAAREWMRSFTPDWDKQVGEAASKATQDNVSNMAVGNQGVTEALKRMEKAHSGEVNRKILDTLDMIKADIPKNQKDNLFEAFFGNKEKGLLARLPDREFFYSRMTDPGMIREVKALGPKQFSQYFDYVTNEFRDGVFGRDLADVQAFDLNSIPGLKITWNDVDKQWGIDIGKDKNIHLRQNYHIPNDSAHDAYLRNKIIPTVNRLNMAIEGLTNVLNEGSEDETKTTAYLHQILGEAAKDQEGGGDNMAVKMWKTISGYIKAQHEQAMKEDAEARRKAKQGPGKEVAPNSP